MAAELNPSMEPLKQPTWLMTLKRHPGELRDWLENNVIRGRKPGKEFRGSWSCGVTKKMSVGDRFYLLNQGTLCDGIIGHGRITSRWYLDDHWDGEKRAAGKKALFVKVMFEDIRNPFSQSFLERSNFKNRKLLRDISWNSQSSGTGIPPEAVSELDRLWNLLKRGIARPERVLNFQRLGVLIPARVVRETIRFVRDRSVADQVKAAYENACQRCRKVVLLRNRVGYAEAAHVRSLKNGGSDTPDNVLCLCPNCHKEMDGGGFQLREDDLHFRPGHALNSANVDHYNRRVFLGITS